MTEFAFHVDRDLNLFCHTLSLYPESFRSEESAFNNPKYRKLRSRLRTNRLTDLFSDLVHVGWADWDFVGLSLLSNGESSAGSFGERIHNGFGRVAGIWSEILTESWQGYSGIWPEVGDRLDEYRSRFEEEWRPIGGEVLKRIRTISETSWNPRRVDVQLVDSLNGGASFDNTILLAPVSNLEVEKKLLAHELSESAFSARGLAAELESAGVGPEFFHAIVDTTAYFAAKDWLKPESVEKLRPNPAYYVGAEPVWSAFEMCHPLSEGYEGFEHLVAVLAESTSPHS
jgi:hypothetical protein